VTDTWGPMTEPFEVLGLEELRTRTSIKWAMYDADVLPLWVAEMDALPAPAIVAAVTDSMLRGNTGYPPLDTSYAEAFAHVARSRWQWEVDVAATCVVADVLVGVREALQLVTKPGDGVIVPSPVYPPLLEFTAALGLRVVPVALDENFRLDIQAIANAMDAGDVTALLLCSPHNPTGTVHNADELDAVAQLAAEFGIGVVVDEIHALLVPEGSVFTPYLSLADNGLVVTSASKAFNLAGLKAATIVAGPESAHLLERLPMSVKYGTSFLGVTAHIAAWRGGGAWIDAVNANIASNIDHLALLLDEHLPEVGLHRPEATYLAWLDCTRLGLGDDPAAAFLERGRVALNSGLPFGLGGAGHVRINLAASRTTIAEAVDRMARTVSTA